MVATATGYRFELDPFEVPAGTELQRCVVLEGLPEDTVVQKAVATQAKGGHHLVAYTGANVQPGQVFDCTKAASMANFRFITPGSFDGTTEDLAFRIPAGKPLVVQAHYINATAAPLTATDSYEIVRVPPAANPKMVDFFAFTDVDFSLPPGPTSITHTCTMDKDLAVLRHFGHLHEYGTRYKLEHLVQGQDPVVLDDYAWKVEYRDVGLIRDAPASAPLMVRAGESLRITCSWNNTLTRPIEFPEEMCVAFFHYLTTEGRPGGFLTCMDGAPIIEP